MRRLIFVGIHNKPGLQPLCSTTRSGKVIDACIRELKPKYRTIKSNFFDLEDLPRDRTDIKYFFAWKERVGYNPVNDIVIMLGDMARRCFISRIGPGKIAMRHPASWATKHSSTDDFVLDLLIKLEEDARKEKARILQGLTNQRT